MHTWRNRRVGPAAGGAGRRSRAQRVARRLGAVVLVGMMTVGTFTHSPASAAQHPLSLARANGITFPGPTHGTPGTQAPGGAAFAVGCNAGVNSELGQVNGTNILTGTAIEASTGCGTAVLPLNNPGQGHFQAKFGVADNDTSGQPAAVRVRVLDGASFSLFAGDFTATRGKPTTIDVDVARAVAIQLKFLKAPTTFVYDVHLTGSARALNPVSTPSNALPSGATPYNTALARVSCNMSRATATTPLTVTLVGIPTAGSFTGTGCGQIALSIPANTHGTLALRYGADDKSDVGVEYLDMRALDAQGHLLRKAIGVAAVGTGLQPLWVDLTGARTVQLYIDGGTGISMDITAISIVPGRAAPYVTQNRVQSGGSATGSIAVDPRAFASQCNSSVGTDDVTVARAPVLGGTYLSTYACGSASLFFCCTNAEGTFHARFAVPDTETSGKPATVKVIVKDKDNHVLRQASYSVTGGNPGASIDVNVKRASIISFLFGGSTGMLYAMRLTGIATISERIYPPSEPPVEVKGGVAINPNDFARQCNADVSTDDLRLVGATTLESWALVGEACGSASLPLTTTHYPRHDFYARVGIKLGEAPNTEVTVVFNVLNAAGKIVRSAKVIARYGYGTQPVHLSLKGGTVVQILWLTQTLSGTVVYAMTAA